MSDFSNLHNTWTRESSLKGSNWSPYPEFRVSNSCFKEGYESATQDSCQELGPSPYVSVPMQPKATFTGLRRY
jgi:hypothetical protein